MSKRVVLKMAVAITALSAVTLLSGCGEDDGIVIGAAWAPVGFVPFFSTAPVGTGGAGGGGGQTGTGGGGAGVTVGSVGGNQVSTGMAVQ